MVYDPNFRARLTTEAAAREAFARIAPWVSVALPSHPVETRALLGVDTPAAAVAACRRLGVGAVAVTCGAEGVLVGDHFVPAAPVPAIVDATGAGDAFAGTLAARLALGAELLDAVGDGVAAAARSLGGRGGTGWITG